MILQDVKSFNESEQLHEFMLKHGENLVELMGDEIDRIEMNLSVCIFDLIFSEHFPFVEGVTCSVSMTMGT